MLPTDEIQWYFTSSSSAASISVANWNAVTTLPPFDFIDQSWFWSRKWQEMETRATLDLAAGRFDTFQNAEEFLGTLGG
ncbi:MAG: hypothetical protein ACTSP1_19995 [Candidatus Freyarchaeota archaeon]